MVVAQGRPGNKPGASRHGTAPNGHIKVVDKAFTGTGGHLAYSGFTHIGNLDNLKFAVGLREHSDVEAVIAKLLPMAKTNDDTPKERMIRSPPPVSVLEEEDGVECPKPECCAVRDKIDALDHANDDLKRDVAVLEMSIKTSMNKMSTLDRQHKMAEGAKTQLATQLIEAQGRTATLEVDVCDLQAVNNTLRDKLHGLESRVLGVRREVERKAQERAALQHAMHDQVMFGSPYKHQDGYSWEEEMSVRCLDDYMGQPPMSPLTGTARLHTGAPTIRRDFAHHGRKKSHA